uniref:Uncharacterized protein n=1 Tax=Tetranychus urticae TaxID=32264 RepID=T1L1Y5_TETUR
MITFILECFIKCSDKKFFYIEDQSFNHLLQVVSC